MLSKTTWLAPTAFTLVFAFLAAATGWAVFVAAAGVSVLATVLVLWRDFKPKGKYDLSRLQDVVDREELANLDPGVGVFEFDDYLCPYCRTHYSTERRTCPKCGRTRSS